MPHSPYQKTFYPSLEDIHEYKGSLDRHRIRMENDERDEWRDEALLEIGGDLFEQCDFLETKLAIKKREHGQLVNQIDTLEKANQDLKDKMEALKEESNAQKLEIAALKSDLEKTGTALGTEEQSNAKVHGPYVELSQVVDLMVKEAKKPEESKVLAVTEALMNPLKRGASNDAATDEQAAKKGKTG